MADTAQLERLERLIADLTARLGPVAAISDLAFQTGAAAGRAAADAEWADFRAEVIEILAWAQTSVLAGRADDEQPIAPVLRLVPGGHDGR